MNTKEAIDTVKSGTDGTIAVRAKDLADPQDMVPHTITKANYALPGWGTNRLSVPDWTLYRPAKVWTVEGVTADGAAFSYGDAMAIRAALGDRVKCRRNGDLILSSPTDQDGQVYVPRYTFTRATVTEFSTCKLVHGQGGNTLTVCLPDNAEPGEWHVTCRRKA